MKTDEEIYLKSATVDACLKHLEKHIPGLFYTGKDNAYERACWLTVQYRELLIVATRKNFSKETIDAISDNLAWLRENLDLLKQTSPRHNKQAGSK